MEVPTIKPEDFVHMDNPSVLDTVVDVFANYGWYILIAIVVITIIYHKTLKRYVEKYRAYKFEAEYSAKYHKNPDIFAAHVSAQQAWAEKLQEQYNQEAARHQEKMKEREEKQKQLLQEKFAGSGHRLGSEDDTNRNNQTNNLKPESFPLMGGGSSSNYRPPRRSACGGGGCGR